MTTSINSLNSTTSELQVNSNPVMRFGADTSGQPFSFRNLLINGDFRINQRVYVSAAVLASGAYGHDRWKAGASGGDYSFTQLAHSTQITIASGKSIVQVVEDKNVAGGSYVLSWSGTSQARVGLNSATPSGSYAASPILITGQTAGTVMSVEFNTGTLGKVQLEQGSIATAFENRPIGTELALGQRYFEQGYTQVVDAYPTGSSGAQSVGQICFKVSKRATPVTMTQLGSSTSSNVSANSFTTTTVDNSGVAMTIGGAAGLYSCNIAWTAASEL
jgi:hypothetical protein